MRLRKTACLFILGLVITACAGANKTDTRSTSTSDADSQMPAANTSTSDLLETEDMQLTSSCTVVSRKPTPGPTQQSLFPAVDEHDWVRGAQDAEITIIEYGDFQ